MSLIKQKIRKIVKDLKRLGKSLNYLTGKYRFRSVVIVLALLTVAVMESISVAAVLPLLTLDEKAQATGVGNNSIIDFFEIFFNYLGLKMTTEMLLFIIAVFIALKSIIAASAAYLVANASAQTLTDLRLSLMHSLENVKWSFFLSRNSGDYATGIIVESERGAWLYMQICRSISEILQVIAYLVLATMVSSLVTVGALIAGVFSIVAMYKLVKMMRIASIERQYLIKDLTNQMVNGLAGMKPLRAMRFEKEFFQIFKKSFENLGYSCKKAQISQELQRLLFDPLRIIPLCLGLYLLLRFTDTKLDEVFMLALLFVRTVQRINSLQQCYMNILNQLPAFWFVQNLIERTNNAQEDMQKGGKQPTLEQKILFDNVSFRYGSKQVLNNISIEIPAKKITAFTGGSGAGKTTLADIIVGLNRPDSGQVLLDSVPLSQIDIGQWRSKVGYVPQELFLFHDTLLNNIRMSDESISEKQVKKALKQAEALNFVEEMPDRMNTVVGAGGARLSGGQRQRIAIARALVRSPLLLILDEATTALDPATEKAILATMKKLAKETTIIAISHQPALKEIADEIINLEVITSGLSHINNK